MAIGVGAFRHPDRDTGGDSIAAPAILAVLPFTIRGDEHARYLCDGMVDLLSIGLDLPGEVRTIDPRAVLRDDARCAASGPTWRETPEPVLTSARELGASAVVTGDVIAAGGQLRIIATLYDAAHGAHALMTAEAQGDSAHVFQTVDALAGQLLGALHRGPHGELAQIATVTTSSLPALKAYLAGEAAYRRAQYPAAVVAFRHAVTLDSSFALAQYRLALAADWAGLYPLPLTASEAAYRHREHLAPRVRLLLKGFRAWRMGEIDTAEAAYRAAIARGMSDPEAWYELGEVLFHDSGLRGRSPQDARGPFERAVALDPRSDAALVHLFRLAAQRGDRVAVDSFARRLLALAQTERRRDETIAFRAAALGDTAAEARALAPLVRLEDPTLYDLGEYLAVYAHDISGDERFIRHLLPERGDPPWRGRGLTELAIVQLAQGRWREAKASLVAARDFEPGLAIQCQAFLAAQPDLPIPTSDVRAARAALVALPADVGDPVMRRDLWPVFRTYLRGLLDARLGDTTAAKHDVEQLGRVSGDTVIRGAAAAYANSIRAFVAAQRGDTPLALHLLEHSEPHVSVEDNAGYTGDALPERLLRADLLSATGRSDVALAWYASLPASRAQELIVLGPALLGQARVYERTGRPRAAIAAYDALIQLWRNADPEFQPLVRGAEAARTRLLHDAPSS